MRIGGEIGVEKPYITINFDYTNIDRATEKVKQLIGLLKEAKVLRDSLFGVSDNTEFVKTVTELLNED